MGKLPRQIMNLLNLFFKNALDFVLRYVIICRPSFTVMDKKDPNNLAYTSDTLGLHTDMPYDLHPPGVRFAIPSWSAFCLVRCS